jgi:hypothetical protein
MSYVSITAQLKAILEAVTGLNEVYDYEPKELLKYPCATITAQSHQNLFNDTAANRRQYTFTIRCFYRTDDAATAESTLQGIADSVISAIETNVTLNGACDFARPTASKWLYAERELPMRIVEITIEAVKRVNR